MKLIAGIDPGLSGAIAVVDAHTLSLVNVWDMPTVEVKRGKTTKRQLDLHRLDDIFSLFFPATAFVEDVGGMPGQSAPAAFNFGRSVGIIDGLLFAYRVSYTRVAPATWKKAMGANSDKDGTRYRASQLMPDGARHWTRKKDDGRAEAALIALYGARVLGHAS